MSERPVRIAVDIGGTFTDLQVLDARDGSVHAWKTPTTPEDPSVGLLRGVTEAAERFGFALSDVGLLLHGTTIATNAVLERKLPRGVLLTTAGFEDVLEIARHVPAGTLQGRSRSLPCLIARDRRFGVPERMRRRRHVERRWTRRRAGVLARLDASARSPWRSACSMPMPTRRMSGG